MSAVGKNREKEESLMPFSLSTTYEDRRRKNFQTIEKKHEQTI
jgi:hypothetical protein